MIKIGFGTDVHKLKPSDRGFMLIGGVKVPSKVEVVAHSDGDVLLHAIADALLGAAGLGDIGLHYPDTSDHTENMDSRQIIRDINGLLAKKGFTINNIDSTITAEAPKMRPYIERMEAIIADDLNLDASQINIKATTSEKMGFVGREEGIKAEAVALITKEIS